MESVGALYVAFFAGAILMLLLIGCAALPSFFVSLRRVVRQEIARRRRRGLMLADLAKLDADALALEGIYCFEQTRAGEGQR